jgi:hypothetical protein
METNKTDSSERRDPSEKMVMVGTYFRKPTTSVTRHAITWESQGKSRLKITWQ